jgi:hypothetical protein
MIDFEILENGETKFITWAKLCKHVGVKPYMPSTLELASIKLQLAKARGIPLDDVQVRMNRSAIL